MKKFTILIFLLLVSSVTFAAQEHHNFTVGTCRALPTGDMQLEGISDTDGHKRLIAFPASQFKDRVIDRYLSLCMASLASSLKLRVDYLECNGRSCVPTNSTSLNYFK
ncbi:exported hypothetical protein [Vibrio nigripulchritudo SO65]|nr:exported hypothetical protein [Vibrio nigripulchritudo AM115]CCN43936.1 exported hypothetical protein [Vibrio nigripulchritudo FTn2]CCN62792.1 exported hypothetical protein [Vibrio nigripulchritudo POn4]CCN79574.1 exported hypothetical protein [Vibrio nigripulchritudo SO65]